MEWSPETAAQSLGPELAERRSRLLYEARQSGPSADLHALLGEFDAALARIDNGTYGLCETCDEMIEPERLQSDPLICFCLDHLSKAELRAHERDIALATQIQSRLLPPNHIRTASCEASYTYQAAGPVGGDHCELMPSDDRQSLFFAIGDVAGKGVAASLLMTHLSAILRSLLSVGLPIPDIMSRANRLFCESTINSHYATLLCGRLGSDGTGEIAQGGHCRPVILHRGSAEIFEASGLPMGFFNRASYPSVPFRLDVGEALLLYTDGLTEARDEAGLEFGEAHLLDFSTKLVSDGPPPDASTLVTAVTREVSRFRHGAPAHDDLTVIALRRTA